MDKNPKQKVEEAAKLIGDLAKVTADNTELRQVYSEKLHRKEELQRDTEIEHAEELLEDPST